MRKRFLGGVCLALVTVSWALHAQSAGSGTITGTLTDALGAVIPDAKVLIHSVDTGTDRDVTSNGSGIYVAAFLQPGKYDVRVTKPGFAKLERTGLTLEVGRTLTLDFSLPIQSGSETVTVTGEAPILDPSKTETVSLPL